MVGLYLAQLAAGEEALVRAGVAVVVIDSAASLVPRAELEGEMGNNHAGLQARLTPALRAGASVKALRKLAVPVQANGTVLIFTNQLRIKVGVLFGDAETPTGGTPALRAGAGVALRFYASVRLELRQVRAVKCNGEVIGARIRATVKKNKVAPPYRSAEFELHFGDPCVDEAVFDLEALLGYEETPLLLVDTDSERAVARQKAMMDHCFGGIGEERKEEKRMRLAMQQLDIENRHALLLLLTHQEPEALITHLRRCLADPDDGYGERGCNGRTIAQAMAALAEGDDLTGVATAWLAAHQAFQQRVLNGQPFSFRSPLTLPTLTPLYRWCSG